MAGTHHLRLATRGSAQATAQAQAAADALMAAHPGLTVELVFVDGNLQGTIPTFDKVPSSPAVTPKVIATGALQTHASQP